MAAPTPIPRGPILVANITGRDGTTPALFVPDDRVREASNVDWFESSLGRKRGGAANVSLAGGTAQTGVISSIFTHVPTFDQGGREMWSVDDQATPRFKRLAGGTAWANVTLKDNVATKPWEVNSVSFNGKLYLAYDSTVNRLQVWDPVTGSVRRVGIDKATAPTVADTGGGTYAATIRYYKIRWVELRSGVTYRAGELSSAVSFTPSGAGTAARVTQSTPPGEGETHWEVFGSPDAATYFRLSQVVVGTTTYDDSAVPLSYSGTIPPDVNAFIAPPSAKYLAADDARVVMAGAWETAAGNSMEPKTTRFWWTSPLGSTDNGDDERISNSAAIKSYDDIDEDFTGIGGPINGALFMFSYGGVWKSIKSPQADAPYITTRISGAQGSISHKAIVKAEDENGEACLYWLSPVGPVRYGNNGFQRCHEDIDDIWRTVNLSAATVVAHGVYHRDKHQIWWWVATSIADEPDTKIVFDTHLGKVVDTIRGVEKSVRGGWAKHTGNSAVARCSTMMSDTLGASMSRTTKPYIGRATGTLIWKCDTGTTDAGTTFRSYIQTKDYIPWGLGKLGSMPEEAVLCAGVSFGASITLSIYPDFIATLGTESTVSLTQLTNENRRVQKFGGSAFQNFSSVQFIIGELVAVDASWNLDAVIARWTDSGMI